jgi:small subunit ribosomal protein S16
MLVIHLFRVGKKNQPSFKIVVAERGKPVRAGRFVEQVGFYNPVTKEKILKQERIKYWLSVGAQPSPTAFNLFVSEKIIEGKKIDVHKKPKKKAAAPGGEPRPEGSGGEEKPGEPAATAAAAAPVAETKPEEIKEETKAEKAAEPKPEPKKEAEPVKAPETAKEEAKTEPPKPE